MPKHKKDSTGKGKDSLKLVDPQEAQPDLTAPPARKPRANNFWNSCPLQLEYLPTSPCELGEKSCKVQKEEAAPCPWSINSKEHNYCFWKYIQAHSLPNGQMRPLLQNEISQLMGCSATKIHFTEKEAKRKLKESGQMEALAQLLTGNEGESDDHEINNLVTQIEERYTPDDE